MRVAMLYPAGEGRSLRGKGFRENLVSLLTAGLERKGVIVTLFEVENVARSCAFADSLLRGESEDAAEGPEVQGSLQIAELFERGDEFDLIHNHLDGLPLTYLKMTSTPVLTTIYEALSLQVLPVYRKYNGWAYYLAVDDSPPHPELNYIATIRHDLETEGGNDDRIVEDYFHVYRKIVAQRHREDHRPWGFYRVIEDEPDHKVKRIVVYPGERLSLQRHRHRTEHWMILQGQAEITRNQEIITMASGQAIDIPQGAWHRVRNPGTEKLAFIEVQTGDYFGEDDIERAEDDYGRA